MSGIISSLSGAPNAASQAGGYYTNAANQIASRYGSPLANEYAAMEMGAERPQQQALLNQAAAGAAAMGITGSGEGRANLGNVDAQNSATLAGTIAPLFQQGLSTAADVIGQMPGAQNQAYQDAIQQFYQAVSMAGQAAAGMPPSAGAGPSGPGQFSSGSPNYGAPYSEWGNTEYTGASTAPAAPSSPSGYYSPGV